MKRVTVLFFAFGLVPAFGDTMHIDYCAQALKEKSCEQISKEERQGQVFLVCCTDNDPHACYQPRNCYQSGDKKTVVCLDESRRPTTYVLDQGGLWDRFKSFFKGEEKVIDSPAAEAPDTMSDLPGSQLEPHDGEKQ